MSGFYYYCLRFFYSVIFLGGITVWIDTISFWDRSCDYLKSAFEDESESTVYDFIVVGGGSSGLVISSRLSKHHKVLLIEAGSNPIALQKIPGLAYALLNHPNHDWMYESVPQRKAALSFLGRKIRYPRGKSLGGSSNLNFMLYLRGNPQDYDNWANITGDETWNYENVLPYFKKSLVYNGRFSENLHHYGKSPHGNLHVEKLQYAPLRNEFIEAGKELGYDEIDVNSDQRTGFGDFEVTNRQGSRWGVYRAFLEGVSNKNLKILRYSQSTKIQLDKTKRAIGVHYEQHGRKKYAKATKEIIISCGAIDSPKLLMLSGIGPYQHLESLGINVKISNKHVGKNLEDHIAVPLIPITIDKPLSYIPFRDFNLNEIINYAVNGKGIFTNPSAFGAQAFISSSFVKHSGTDWPDLQMYMSAVGISPTIIDDTVKFLGHNETVLKSVFEPYLGKDGFVILTTLVRPKGKGVIMLQNKNHLTAPLIDPKFLENSHDLKVLIEGMRFANTLTKTKTLKKLGAKYHHSLLPECKNHKCDSDAYWECHIKHFAFSLYHPTGTCAMGKVVDSKLRVKNAIGLRIADSSIMPRHGVFFRRGSFSAIYLRFSKHSRKSSDWFLKVPSNIHPKGTMCP